MATGTAGIVSRLSRAGLLLAAFGGAGCGEKWRSGVSLSPNDPPQGKTIYAAKCARCHGKEGEGSAKLAVRYPGVELRDRRWRGGGALADIEKAVREGVPGTPMAPFSRHLSVAELRSVATFVKQLSNGQNAGTTTPGGNDAER